MNEFEKSDFDENLLKKVLSREVDLTDINSYKEQNRLMRVTFHLLWGKAIRNEPYNKQEWMVLQYLLNKRDIDV